MRIGIDFDNTIVGYDRLFHRVAVAAGLLPPHIPASKRLVRDHLRRTGQEERWTEIQGEVYGSRMSEAEPLPGVLDFLRRTRDLGIPTAIISHKTRYPFLGPRHDLHKAARDWVEAVLTDSGGPLVAADHVFFELTKEEKLARIAAVNCTHFIDDLPEILTAVGFPDRTQRILLDVDDGGLEDPRIIALSNWQAVSDFFEALWISALQKTS